MSEGRSIYSRLRDAQLELKAPKNETGRFGKSRSFESILEAAKPVLHKYGLTLNVTDDMAFVEGRHYVQATATVYDDESNSVSAKGHAWEGELDRGLDTSQVTGKTSSYARKYALGGLLAIDDTKDADVSDDTKDADVSDDTKPQATKPPARLTVATRTQKAQITALLRGAHIADENMMAIALNVYGFDLKTLTSSEATKLIDLIRAEPPEVEI